MKRGKIAIIVPNPCNPDYRVIRQAETLAADGYEVRIFATKNAATPAYETFGGVKYIRSSWNLVRDFARWVTGVYRMDNQLRPVRNHNANILAKAKSRSVREDIFAVQEKDETDTSALGPSTGPEIASEQKPPS